MNARRLIAAPWLIALRARRLAVGRAIRPGSFRILVLHDVPERCFEQFDALVGHLKAVHGVISPAEAAARLARGATSEAKRTRARLPWLLSFDDGLVSNLAVARSILRRHDVKALFFVCPGLTGLARAAQRRAIAANIFDGALAADELAPEQRLMDWSELEELRAAGHEIGAHGLTHRRLATLGGDELAADLAESRRLISAALNAEVPWFAYPFGDIGSIDAAAVTEIGRHFRYCRSGVRGANHPGTDPLALLADAFDLDSGRVWQRLILDGGLDFRYRAARRSLAAMVD